MNMRILITGTTGFLGSHLARMLVKGNHDVIAACRPTSSRWRLGDIRDRLHWVPMDLGDAASILSALSETRPHIVIHCAAYGMNYSEQSFEEGVKCNLVGTHRLLQASVKVGVKRFIHSGSCFEYGDKSIPVSENDVLGPISMYGVTKAAATLLAIQQSEASGLPTVVLRPFGIFGPADRNDKFVPQVISACLSKTPIDLSGGEQTRDYIYIEDAVSLYGQLVEAEEFPTGQIFNVAGGQPVPLRRIGEIIGHLLNFTQGLRWGSRPYHHDEIKTLTAQTDKVKRLLGWSASTTLEQGLAKTIQWYQQDRTAMSLDG